MNDEPSILNFESRRAAAAHDQKVRCPRCHKRIPLCETRCKYCSLNFDGEAWEFAEPTRTVSTGKVMGFSSRIIALVVIVLIAMWVVGLAAF